MLPALGLQALSVPAPQARPHALAGVLHLGTGDLHLRTGDAGVTLSGRDAGVAEDLLHDPDVDALLDEERPGRVGGVMGAGLP